MRILIMASIMLSLLTVFLLPIVNGHALSVSFLKDDSVITAQLEAKIALDPLLSKTTARVMISTSNKIVSIAGLLPSAKEATRLIMIAESIAGVQSVDIRQLVLEQGPALTSDEVITSQVKGLYLREGLIIHNMQVNTWDGTVYLSGIVNDAEEAESAVKLARTIPGVEEVKSTISVSSTAVD